MGVPAAAEDGSGEGSAAARPGKPLTVLELAPPPGHGGPERALHEIAAALVRSGARVVIAAAETPSALRLRSTGASLVGLDLDTRSPLRVRSNARAVADLARAEGVDLIHARSAAAAAAGLRAVEETGAAFVTTWSEPEEAGMLARPLFDALAAGAPVIAPSGHVAELLRDTRGLGPERVVTIPRGADMAVFAEEAVSPMRALRMAEALGLAEDARPLILSPGRIAPGKGRRTLVRALARLKAERGPDFTALIVGEGEGAQARLIEAEIAAVGAGDVVRLAGPAGDMPAALMLSALVVAPATEPQLSARILLEAQAMGRPVIAADHGAAREAVRHGGSGWLVPPGDEAALAGALSAALDLDESGRAHMAMAGRALVRSRFRLEDTIARTLEVYEAAASGARSAA